MKGLPKPLALYLFSNDRVVQKRVISEISSGGVCVNDTLSHLINPNLPFGGVGNSGMGAYHGKYSFLTFSHAKGVLKKSSLLDNPLLFPPFTENRLKLLKKVFK